MSDAPRTPSERVDVCVVGSGPAGALTAYALADRGYDVVVLEAGPRFDFENRIDRMERALRPSHDPIDIWDMGGPRDDYTNSGEVTYPLNSRRVKGVGGSSLHWGGRLERLKRKDFEMESRYGVADDWPISYADLRPYYAAAEKELGAAGEAQLPFGPPREEPPPMDAFPPSYTDKLVAEACDELGIELHRVLRAINSEPYDGRSECQGYGTCWPVCPSGAKYSADVHVEKARDRGARILDRVPVQRLHHDDGGDRIVSAEYVTPEGETHRQEAREFVLACGGVETPRLLLLSKSETYPDGLANSSGLVGRYFEERPAAVLRAQVDIDTRQHLIGFGTTESHQFYNVDDVPPGSIKLEVDNNAGPRPVDLALQREDALHAVQDVLRNPTDPAEWSDLDGTPETMPWGDDLLDEMRSAYGNTIQLSAAVEELPHAENRVTLDPSVTDDHGNPVPDISWSRSEFASKTMDRAFEIMHSILDELDATVRSRTEIRFWKGIGHHLGTTRMGEDPAESVVNPRLRSHDLENLSIVSSSVFVTGGAMQPTLTIAALALRAADHLDERL
jgi:choline dehydrogenase-like flavoprotein